MIIYFFVKLHRKLFVIALICLFCTSVQAQVLDSVKYEVGVSASATSNGVVPFWMRSNQYGSIPLTGASSSFHGKIIKEYNPHRDSSGKHRLWDWGLGVEGRMNIGNRAQFIPIEAYIKARTSIFQLKIGRSKEIFGLVDSTLSSGAFSIYCNRFFRMPITSCECY